MAEQVDMQREVREEQRRGFLIIDDTFIEMMGEDRMKGFLKFINLETYGTYRDEDQKHSEYYGYCPLFAPLKFSEKTPTYTMKVDFSESLTEPIVETFQRRDE